MPKKSILTKGEISKVLKHECAHKEAGQDLIPTVLVQTVDDLRYAYFLKDLPEESGDRPAYFAALGRWARNNDVKVAEAIFISEAWAVANPKTGLGIMPSQHPDRIDTIIVIGRNVENTRHSLVVKPFRHNAEQKVEWQKAPFAIYDEPMSEQARTEGLLDYFFEALGET